MARKNGFSLVELLVVVGVSGAISMAAVTLITVQLSMGKNMEVKAAIGDVVGAAKTVLSNKVTCLAALKLAAPSISPSNLPKSLNVRLQVGDDLLRANTALTDYPLKVARLYAGNFRNAGTDSAGENIYIADIIGEFAPKNVSQGILEGYKPRAVGSVFFTTNASGNLASCGTVSPDTLRLADICRYVGGTPNTASNTCDMPAATNTTTTVVVAGPATGSPTNTETTSGGAHGGDSGRGTF